eukprot:scaffold11732_cov181-Alexandrium_tamarense.AAC.5
MLMYDGLTALSSEAANVSRMTATGRSVCVVDPDFCSSKRGGSKEEVECGVGCSCSKQSMRLSAEETGTMKVAQSIKCHGHGHSAPSINTDDPSPPAHQRHPPSHQTTRLQLTPTKITSPITGSETNIKYPTQRGSEVDSRKIINYNFL